MNYNKPWTKEEDDALEKMCAMHLTPDDMLPVFKSRTREAIARRINRRGLNYIEKPEIDMDAFNKLMKGK